jgi:hypothetical protein
MQPEILRLLATEQSPQRAILIIFSAAILPKRPSVMRYVMKPFLSFFLYSGWLLIYPLGHR